MLNLLLKRSIGNSVTLVTGHPDARAGLDPGDEQLLGALLRLTQAALSIPASVGIARVDAAQSPSPPTITGLDGSSGLRCFSSPLKDPIGNCIGVLRASAESPGVFTDADLSALRDAADAACRLMSQPPAFSRTPNLAEKHGRNLFEIVLATTDCGIVVCDLNGDLVLANPAAAQLTGMQIGQYSVHRASSFRLLEPDGTELEPSQWPLMRALAEGFVETRIVCLPAADGTLAYHRVSARQLRDDSSTPFGAVAIFSDVTDLYLRTAQVQAGRDRAELLISAASDAFFSFDADGLVREWSPGAEELFGFAADEVLGRRFDGLIVAEGTGSEIQARLTQGGTFEVRANTKTAMPIDAEISGWITEVDGTQSHSIFVRDITERKALEISQTRAYDELTQALDSMGRNIALVRVIRDDNGEPDHLVISWLNRYMLDKFDLSLSQAEGQRLAEVFPGVATSGLHERYLEVARTGETLRELLDDFDDGAIQGSFVVTATPWSVDGLLIEVTNVTEQRVAEISRERSERMLANAQRAAGIGSYEYDVARNQIAWTREMYQIFGRDPAGSTPTEQAFRSWVHPEDRPLLAHFLEVDAGKDREYLEYRIVRPDGSVRHLSDWMYFEVDSEGRRVRVTGAVQDQTERCEREIALAQSRELERLVVDLSPIGVALLDESGNFVKVNNAFCAMQGRTRDALLHTNFLAVSHPEDRANVLTKHEQVISGKLAGVNYDERYVHANGRSFWVSVHKTLLQGRDSAQPLRTLVQVIDISDRQQRADELTRQARTDQLTGLANRRTWEPRLASALAEAQRNGTPLAVAIFDLDKFKQFNDTYGHPVGDELLAETSAAWRAYMIRHAPRGLIARLGGEEFGVLLPRCDAAAASKVLAGMSSVVQRGQTASAGFAVVLPSDDVHTIMTRADTALYAAKNAGRARVEFGAAA